jgi:cellulose biosynthesis protein BcsQ
MVIKLALLSGKGGSGKTSIALSLAKMLSSCGIRTLLLDCDLQTNGATYFVESLIDKGQKLLSVSDFFDNDEAHLLDIKNVLDLESVLDLEYVMNVSDDFHFIPSRVFLPDKRHITTYNGQEDLFHSFIKKMEYDEAIDVIIFDCQAGYSEVVNAVLSVSTVNIVVMEPDAISSSSVRVLYSQTAERLESNRTYQIFSKITEEEYGIYEKVSGGLLFDPLPPISFNWEVRKAFALAQIPDLYSTNAIFGENIYDVAVVLFPKLKKQLFGYKRILLETEKEEIELEIEEIELKSREIIVEEKRKKQFRIFRIFIFAMIMIFLLIILFEELQGSKQIFEDFISTIIFLLTALVSGIIGYNSYSPKSSSMDYKMLRIEINKRKKRLSDIWRLLQNETK